MQTLLLSGHLFVVTGEMLTLVFRLSALDRQTPSQVSSGEHCTDGLSTAYGAARYQFSNQMHIMLRTDTPTRSRGLKCSSESGVPDFLLSTL